MELKNTINVNKTSIEIVKIRVDQLVEKFCEHKNSSFEIIVRGKSKNNNEKGVRYIQVRNICIMGILEERKSQETF